MHMDDYETVLGMEFWKQYETIIVPHMKKLYIYIRQDDETLGIPIVEAMTARCKLTAMNVEDIKQDEEIYERLSAPEIKLVEQSQVIRALSDNILDLTGRLEVVKGNKDARPKT